MPRAAFLSLGALLVLALSLKPLMGRETDIFWHLAAGRRFLSVGFEGVDPFSFTHAGVPWIHIDWLFQPLIYLIYQVGGMGALLGLRSLLLLATAAAAYAVARLRGCNPWCALALTLWASFIWSSFEVIRPQMFTVLYLAVLALVLQVAHRDRPRLVWCVPPLTWLFYQIHVAALAGVLFMGLFTLGRFLERRSFRSDPFLGAAVLTPLVIFLSPQPWEIFWIPFSYQLGLSVWKSVIVEMGVPVWNDPLTLAVRGLWLLGLAGCLRRRAWTDVLPTLGMGFFLLVSYRHQFVMVCGLLAPAAEAASALRSPNRKLAWLALSLAAAYSLLWMTATAWPIERLLRQETFPSGISNYLRQTDRPTRLFADFNMAGYYMFYNPECRVFVDARCEQVYREQDFMQEYFRILLGRQGALELLDQHQVDAIALQVNTFGVSALFQDLLPKSGHWAVAYDDGLNRLYVRKKDAWPPPTPPRAFLLHYANAVVQANNGQLPAAIAELRQSLHDYPDFLPALQMVARIALERGDLRRARTYLSRVELLLPKAPGLEEDWARCGAPSAFTRLLCLPWWALE